LPHDPVSFHRGTAGSRGQKKKMEKPRPSPAGPGNPCTRYSAHAKPPWFTRSRWTPNKGGAHHSRAIETAHDDLRKSHMPLAVPRTERGSCLIQAGQAVPVCMPLHNCRGICQRNDHWLGGAVVIGARARRRKSHRPRTAVATSELMR